MIIVDSVSYLGDEHVILFLLSITYDAYIVYCKSMIFDTRHLVIEMSCNLKMFASKIGYGLIYAKCKQP